MQALCLEHLEERCTGGEKNKHKDLRWARTWTVPRTARRPVRLEESEQGEWSEASSDREQEPQITQGLVGHGINCSLYSK